MGRALGSARGTAGGRSGVQKGTRVYLSRDLFLPHVGTVEPSVEDGNLKAKQIEGSNGWVHRVERELFCLVVGSWTLAWQRQYQH